MTPRYEAVVVDRKPSESGPPEFIEIEPLVGIRNLSWTRRLSNTDQASIGFPARLQAEAVKTRLMNLDGYPVELWVRRGETLVHAGPITAVQVQSGTATITSLGVASYLDRWYVEPGDVLEYSAVDQLDIARGLINYWQSKPFGHFGITWGSEPTSDVMRDRTYDGAKPNNIGQRLRELSAVQNGFDWRITPTRQLILGYPTLGADKTQTVIVDHRVIVSSAGAWSVGPRDFTTEGYVWAQESTAQAGNPDARATWGRVGHGMSESSATEQDTLDQKAEAIVKAMSRHLHVPSPTVINGGDFDVADLDVGDLIRVEADYGLGLYVGDHRVGTYTVRLDDKGHETVRLEFV